MQNTRTQRFLKPSKPCHVVIYWIALAEYSQMSTHVLGFQSFLSVFLQHFVLAKFIGFMCLPLNHVVCYFGGVRW